MGKEGVDYFKSKLHEVDKMYGLWLVNSNLKDEGIITLSDCFNSISMLQVLLLGSIYILGFIFCVIR